MSEIEDLRRDVIELRDWKEAVLGKCKASSGWDDLKWGGDKEGWGFVHYFIGHLNTRALEAEAALATPTAAQAPTISVKPMQLSDDRTDYFVSISVGDHEITPYVFREQFKAEYEAASFRWLLLGEPKPDLMAYSEDGWPASPSVPSAEGKCDTTLTERFTNPACRCKTYAGNKGPCKSFETGQNGNCVYCDHEQGCHTSPLPSTHSQTRAD